MNSGEKLDLLDWTYRTLRWGLGAIFIYAGGTKLLAPEIFAVLIEAYGIVPDALLMPVAIMLPLMEVIAGIGLLFDIRGSLAIFTMLLVLFIAILGFGITMGLDVDCGCFGPQDPEAEAFHSLRLSLYRDLGLLAGVVLLYVIRRAKAIRPTRVALLIQHLFRKRRRENVYG